MIRKENWKGDLGGVQEKVAPKHKRKIED